MNLEGKFPSRPDLLSHILFCVCEKLDFKTQNRQHFKHIDLVPAKTCLVRLKLSQVHPASMKTLGDRPVCPVSERTALHNLWPVYFYARCDRDFLLCQIRCFCQSTSQTRLAQSLLDPLWSLYPFLGDNRLNYHFERATDLGCQTSWMLVGSKVESQMLVWSRCDGA